MLITGIVGAWLGSVFTALRIFMCVAVLSISVVDIYLLVMEKRLITRGITED